MKSEKEGRYRNEGKSDGVGMSAIGDIDQGTSVRKKSEA